jgi:hypothetical protein
MMRADQRVIAFCLKLGNGKSRAQPWSCAAQDIAARRRRTAQGGLTALRASWH